MSAFHVFQITNGTKSRKASHDLAFRLVFQVRVLVTAGLNERFAAVFYELVLIESHRFIGNTKPEFLFRAFEFVQFL